MYNLPDDPRLHETEQPDGFVFCLCSWCDDEIHLGDDYYRIGAENICQSCVDSCRTIAEVD